MKILNLFWEKFYSLLNITRIIYIGTYIQQLFYIKKICDSSRFYVSEYVVLSPLLNGLLCGICILFIYFIIMYIDQFSLELVGL